MMMGKKSACLVVEGAKAYLTKISLIHLLIFSPLNHLLTLVIWAVNSIRPANLLEHLAVLNKLGLMGIIEGVRWSWLKGKALRGTGKNMTSTS